MRSLVLLLVAVAASAGSARQADLHGRFDKILDTYVRDGFVYYRALELERASLDRYVASLDVPSAQVSGWPRDEQIAFWINAYNALVLRTVVDHYPIKGKVADFPANSIRQIPGSFERLRHRVGGQSLTLDEIEKKVLAGFGDARVVLALGRGAFSSGRLRSEVYRGAALDKQLTEAIKECVSRALCLKIDPPQGLIEISPLFGWREELFVASFGAAGGQWANRTPIERGVVAMVYPHVFPTERDFLAANTFRVEYNQFDWRLNDLAAR